MGNYGNKHSSLHFFAHLRKIKKLVGPICFNLSSAFLLSAKREKYVLSSQSLSSTSLLHQTLAYQTNHKTHDVKKNTWLRKVYTIKEKWTSCYMKKGFTLGMRSTQLSECVNADIKSFTRVELDIINFS